MESEGERQPPPPWGIWQESHGIGMLKKPPVHGWHWRGMLPGQLSGKINYPGGLTQASHFANEALTTCAGHGPIDLPLF